MSQGDPRELGVDRRQLDMAGAFTLRKSIKRGLPLLAGQRTFALVFARQVSMTCSTFGASARLPNVLITPDQKVSIGTNPNSPNSSRSPWAFWG